MAQSNREWLSVEDLGREFGLSRKFVYSLTCGRKLPHFKPTGRKVFFRREDVEAFLQSGRIKTASEIEAEATNRGGK